MCVFQFSYDVSRVAQQYGTIAAHTRCRASVLVVFVVFCLHMHSFAALIRRMPPPTFSDTAITDRHSDTTIFQIRAQWLRISWSIGSEKSFGHVAPGGSRTLNFLRARRAPYPLRQALRYHSLMPLKYSIVFATPVNCCQNRLKGVKAALCHCSGCGIDLIAKVTNHMSLIRVLYTDTRLYS